MSCGHFSTPLFAVRGGGIQAIESLVPELRWRFTRTGSHPEQIPCNRRVRHCAWCPRTIGFIFWDLKMLGFTGMLHVDRSQVADHSTL